MGISINGPSGIDTQYIIESLVAIEQQRVTVVEDKKDAYQLKIDAYAKLKTLLTDLGSRASSLSKLSSFDVFKTTSTNEEVATVTGGIGSVDGTYDIEVFQLAGNEKMISGDSLVADQAAALSSYGIGVGTISIDGVEIDIDSDDTLQDLRQKINGATDVDGNRIGVSASVLRIADDNYRLVLTAKEGGSEGIVYQDITGSTLQDLGVITDAAGNKGTTSQVVSSAGNVQTAWDALADGESVEITATDRAGNEVTAAIVKKPGSTSDDFLEAVNAAFNGMVEATFGGGGELVLTDRIGGDSQLNVSEMLIGGTAESMSVSTWGEKGDGVLSVGRDAFFSIENIHMSNSTNSATGFVQGVTFDFHSVSEGAPVTVELERDQDEIKKKFKEMINAYNAILRFSKSSTQVADPNDEDTESGDLAGDSTIRSIVSQINTSFHQQFEELNTVYTSFSMLGLKTNTQTSELELDDEMFNKALKENYDEVVNLFITIGTSDNNSVQMGTSSVDTKAGNYILEEVDADHFRARLESGTTWYTSEARMGEIVSFEDGPLTGLSLTAPSGSIGAGNQAAFTLSKGLSAIIDDAIDGMTDSQEGLVAMRTESWQRSMSRADDRISQLEIRIENYRERLVKQFTAMELSLSELQAQSSNMVSALGNLQYGTNN